MLIADSAPGSAVGNLTTYHVPAVVQVSGVQSLNAVACESDNSCVAVGYENTDGSPATEGVVVPLVDGEPGTVQPVPGTVTLTGVSCPSAATCVAVGNQDVSFDGSNPTFSVGEIVSITDGVPGSPVEAPPGPDPWVGSPNELFLNGVSCTKVSSCVAVGNDDAYNGVVVPIKRGQPGDEEVIGGSEQTLVNGVTCSVDCYAAGTWSSQGGGAAVITIAHKKPTGVGEYPSLLLFSAIACYGVSDSCMAVGRTQSGGTLVPITKKIDQISLADVTPTAITCRSATYCVAVGSDSGNGAIVKITNDVPGKANLLFGAESFGGVACSGTADCLAVGSDASGAVVESFKLPS